MDFPMVLRKPYQQCKDRKIVVSGFRKAGVFPFNPSAIDSSKIVPLTSKKQQPQKTATPSSPTPYAPPPAVIPSKYMSHPLVAAGLNNPELAEIFTEIDNQKKTTPRQSKMKAPLNARVISEEEYEREMKLESARKRDGKTPSPRSTTPRRRKEPPTSPATSPSEGETASPTVKQTSKSSGTRSRSHQTTEEGRDRELEAEQPNSRGPQTKRAGLRHRRLDYVDNSNDEDGYGINQASAKTISPLKSVLPNTHTKIEAVHRNMWQPYSDEEDVSEISDLTSTDFEDNEYEQQIEAMRKAKIRRLMQRKTVLLSESDDDSSDDEPLVKMITRNPSDEELKTTVKKLLAHVDLEKVAMKDIFKKVFKMYPRYDLSNKKSYIKETVKKLLSQ
ncbi:uncharacterized protein F59B10.2-like isoform X2 [Salmo trutta]|uniref:uncharacterized protein F59B10.2-like isoform X2 n=1 Tax=Salmo trutta TaxID=8032 RepID=UPI0011327039|nr:uncharacterized protein F59B10.2-like isoform X2 [Salmo trutta]